MRVDTTGQNSSQAYSISGNSIAHSGLGRLAFTCIISFINTYKTSSHCAQSLHSGGRGGGAWTTVHTAVIHVGHCLGGAQRKFTAGPRGAPGGHWPTIPSTGKESEAGDPAAWTKPPGSGRARTRVGGFGKLTQSLAHYAAVKTSFTFISGV